MEKTKWNGIPCYVTDIGEVLFDITLQELIQREMDKFYEYDPDCGHSTSYYYPKYCDDKDCAEQGLVHWFCRQCDTKELK